MSRITSVLQFAEPDAIFKGMAQKKHEFRHMSFGSPLDCSMLFPDQGNNSIQNYPIGT